jgi:hypothetical protein
MNTRSEISIAPTSVNRKRDRLASGTLMVVTISACLWMSGCFQTDDAAPGDVKLNDTKVSGDGQSPKANGDDKSDDDKLGDYCKDWKKPAIAFMVTGQMHGYFEPCGCSEPQYGGVSRRADLLRQLREDKGWHVEALDLGGTLKRSRKQSQFKFETLLNSLKDMKYRAVAVGVEELKMGFDWLLSQCVNNSAEQESVVLLSSNLTFRDLPDFGPVPFSIAKAGKYKVGITSVFGPKLVSQLGTLDAQISIQDPSKALRATLDKMKAEKCDMLVLLAHATIAESKALAKEFPEFKLVVSTGPIEDPIANNPIRIGESTFAVVGHKGKRVGVIGVYPDSKDKPIRMELVKLDGKRFKDDPKMIEHMKQYQELLQKENLVESEPTIPHPSGHSYVGAARCGTCHEKAFDKWKTTGHAKAFDSIKKGRRDIPRIHDPECLSCHVTGWEPQQVLAFKTGYKNEKESAHLLGNQCENCHGPGSEHVNIFENGGDEKKAKELMRVTLKQAENNVCYSCHDLDNSPHFKFEEYWKKVAHPWRD